MGWASTELWTNEATASRWRWRQNIPLPGIEEVKLRKQRAASSGQVATCSNLNLFGRRIVVLPA